MTSVKGSRCSALLHITMKPMIIGLVIAVVIGLVLAECDHTIISNRLHLPSTSTKLSWFTEGTQRGYPREPDSDPGGARRRDQPITVEMLVHHHLGSVHRHVQRLNSVRQIKVTSARFHWKQKTWFIMYAAIVAILTNHYKSVELYGRYHTLLGYWPYMADRFNYTGSYITFQY